MNREMDHSTPDRFRTPQGVGSLTFHPPPLDGSLTIPELFFYHAEHSPNHPLFVYHDDSKDQLRSIYYPEACRAIAAASLIASDCHSCKESAHSNTKTPGGADYLPTFGILAIADTVTYVTVMTGILHAGFSAFPLSSRNSITGTAHLIRETGIRLIFVSPDPAMQRLSKDVAELLNQEGIELHLLPLPQFRDLYRGEGAYMRKPVKTSQDATILILHSSGSAAQPKPVRISGRALMSWGMIPYDGEIDICGIPLGVQALPMFHAMGVITFIWALFAGNSMACFKPLSSPVVPTPENFFDAIVTTQSSIIYCVPAFIEAWARSEDKLPVLKRLKALIYSGAPMNEAVGNYLAYQGVPLMPLYGMTEVGCLSLFAPLPPQPNEWPYFRFSPHLRVEMDAQGDHDDLFEPIVVKTATSGPNVINTVYAGTPAYITRDLLQRHPTKAYLYRVYGRADDQIMLSTGEKTNPGPLEAMLVRDPHIAAALMFGRGRFQNGVLIQPRVQFDPTNDNALIHFRNEIWPTIEAVNEYAPAHSRIFKEMILVTHPGKPLEFTPKGTPRRQACLKAYSEEIDALYASVSESSQTDLKIPDLWTPESALAFIRLVVVSVMKRPMSDNDDFFQYGCDSLQATWIRNSITRALRASATAAVHHLPGSFVYAHPTVMSLGQFVWKQFFGMREEDNPKAKLVTKVAEMEALVQKLGRDLPAATWPPREGRMTSQTVLLTGCTGRFGCHILSQLTHDPNVRYIYALNREAHGSDATLAGRQSKALDHWGLSDANLAKVKFVACDFTEAKLGIPKDQYEEMQQNVTVIIHNAWRVDFNLNLSSFGPLISGVRHLIDFALGCVVPGGPHLVFISSISTLRNHPTTDPAPEAPVEAGVAVGAGYGESKWVGESLVTMASQGRNLRSTVVRVGQLSGDTRVGGWGSQEWAPSLIAASQAIGCIPMRDNMRISWIPVDIAASALLDMSFEMPKEGRTLYLLSPKPVKWDQIFATVAKHIGVPVVPYSDWLVRLQENSDDGEEAVPPRGHNTARHLISFYEQGDFGEPLVSLQESLKISPTLAQCRPLSVDNVLLCLRFWEDDGFTKHA